jgi:NitT/TauT family transport system substrate-binding protein
MTYEPYLSTVRDKPEAGKIIATTLDYPMIMDTFGCAEVHQRQPRSSRPW